MSGPVRAAEHAGSAFGLGEMGSQARQENFPVASVLIPRRYRRHLMRIYTFARLVDDIGDEASVSYIGDGDSSSGNTAQSGGLARARQQAEYRARLLDSVDDELELVFSGREPAQDSFRTLAETVHTLGLQREPFDRLVRANRQDQLVTRYATFGELTGYCSLSANPVGALVLAVFGVDRDDRRHMSDQICTALQLLEHSQDVAEDYSAGRIYLPTEDLRRFGVAETELAESVASRAVRGLLAFQVQRAVRMLDSGTTLLRTLWGAARAAVAGYVAGGLATADALARARFDVLAGTPRPRPAVVTTEYARLLASGGAR